MFLFVNFVREKLSLVGIAQLWITLSVTKTSEHKRVFFVLFNINKFVLTILKIKIIKILEFIEFFADFSFLVQSVILAVNFINNQTEHCRTRWIAALNYKAPQEQFFLVENLKVIVFIFIEHKRTNERTNERTKEATYIRYWWLVGILGLPLKLKMAQTIIIQKRRNRSGRNHGKQTQFSWTELNEIHSQSHIQHQQQYRPQHEHHQRALVRRSALSANCQLKKLPQISSSLSSSS